MIYLAILAGCVTCGLLIYGLGRAELRRHKTTAATAMRRMARRHAEELEELRKRS